MGSARKLQSEIDRTLKKVQEGVELFDQIWQKVRPSTHPLLSFPLTQTLIFLLPGLPVSTASMASFLAHPCHG
jgi:hypothetical protein